MEKGEPSYPEFTYFDRSFAKDPRSTGSTLIQKIDKNTKINHIMVSFTNHYNAISIGRLPSKLKSGNIHDTLIIFFYVSPRFP